MPACPVKGGPSVWGGAEAEKVWVGNRSAGVLTREVGPAFLLALFPAVVPELGLLCARGLLLGAR